MTGRAQQLASSLAVTLLDSYGRQVLRSFPDTHDIVHLVAHYQAKLGEELPAAQLAKVAECLGNIGYYASNCVRARSLVPVVDLLIKHIRRLTGYNTSSSSSTGTGTGPEGSTPPAASSGAPAPPAAAEAAPTGEGSC